MVYNQLIFVPTRRNWFNPPRFIALAFQNGLKDRNASWDLMSFCPVTPEFTRLECVQQASVSTWVSLTMFARGDTAKHRSDQYLGLFHFSLLGTSLLGRAGYTLHISSCYGVCCRLDQILGRAGSKKADVYESKLSLASRIVKVERQVYTTEQNPTSTQQSL